MAPSNLKDNNNDFHNKLDTNERNDGRPDATLKHPSNWDVPGLPGTGAVSDEQRRLREVRDRRHVRHTHLLVRSLLRLLLYRQLQGAGERDGLLRHRDAQGVVEP